MKKNEEEVKKAMGRRKRGSKDGTGPYWNSYVRRTGQGGHGDRCYEQEPKKKSFWSW